MSARPTSYDWADPRRSSSATTLIMARQELQRKKRLNSVKSTVGTKFRTTQKKKKKKPGVLKSISKSSSTGQMPPTSRRLKADLRESPLARKSNQEEDNALVSSREKLRAKSSRKLKKKSAVCVSAHDSTGRSSHNTLPEPLNCSPDFDQVTGENALDLFDADFNALDLGNETSLATEEVRPEDDNVPDDSSGSPPKLRIEKIEKVEKRSDSRCELVSQVETGKMGFADKKRLISSRERREEKQGSRTLNELKQEHKAALELLREIEMEHK